jgi:hypothetical protein
MKRLLLLATVALVAFTATASADMALRLQEGALVQDFISAPGQSSFSSTPNFAFGDFIISNVTGSVTPSTTAPVLLSANTLDLQSTATGAHTLDIFVTGNNITSPSGLLNLFSGFTNVSLSNGWTANLSTQADNGNGNFTGTVLDTVSFGGDGITTFASNMTALALLTGPYSLTAHFQILTDGVGQANSGIQIAANAVPIPGAVWLFGGGLAGLGAMLRRRKQSVVA